MRTEQELRRGLIDLADQPAYTDALFESITDRLDPRSGRPRPAIFVLALAAVALVLAIAVPQFVTQREVVPADTRGPGNWNLTHTVVNLPPGWSLLTATISGEQEATFYGPESESQSQLNLGDGCHIMLGAAGNGDPTLRTEGRRAVTVAGHPGIYGDDSLDYPGGVSWRYRDDAWANVSCSDPEGVLDEKLSLDIAERVVFTPTVTRLPFEFAQLPKGYVVAAVSPAGPDSRWTPPGVSLTAENMPPMEIYTAKGETSEGIRTPYWEDVVINGLPGALSPTNDRLVLTVQGHSILLNLPTVTTMDQKTALTLTQRRDLLVTTAESMTFAKNLDDRSTWFEANSTLPQ